MSAFWPTFLFGRPECPPTGLPKPSDDQNVHQQAIRSLRTTRMSTNRPSEAFGRPECPPTGLPEPSDDQNVHQQASRSLRIAKTWTFWPPRASFGPDGPPTGRPQAPGTPPEFRRSSNPSVGAGLTMRSSEQRLARGSFSWLSLSSPASVAELEFVRPSNSFRWVRPGRACPRSFCCHRRAGSEFEPAPVCPRSGRSVGTSFFPASRPLRSCLPGGSAHLSPAGVHALSSGGPEALCRRAA